MKNRFFLATLYACAMLALACFVSCSKGDVLEPDPIPLDKQTRAAATLEISSTPEGVWEGQAYYELNKTYRFRFYMTLPIGAINLHVTPILSLENQGVSIDNISTEGMDVRFTAPGTHEIKVILIYNLINSGGGLQQQGFAETTTTCRVMSPVSSITGPASVTLGSIYNFKVNFRYLDLPDPNLTLKITESAFNDPKYTIVSKDDAGNFRIRFDEPGAYKIEANIPTPGRFDVTPCYYVDVFSRPYIKTTWISASSLDGDNLTYDNKLILCDPQTRVPYTYLPFRVYFTYELKYGEIIIGPPVEPGVPLQEAGEAQYVPEVKGTIIKEAGSSMLFGVNMPFSMAGVEHILYTNSDLPQRIPRDYYWEIGIPKDAGYSNRLDVVVEGELKPGLSLD